MRNLFFRYKKKLHELLDKYGESREAIEENADLSDSMEYLFAQDDELFDEVLRERQLARAKSSFPQTPYPSVAKANPTYVSPTNLPEMEKYMREIDYSRYGEGFTQEFINAMLKDKRFFRAMERIRKNEGGYINHPDDKGSETNYGISSKIYPGEDIKNMTPERANAIYYRDYWIKPKIYQLPDDYAEVVFDDGVVQGQPAAIINLQKALGVHVDGIIGFDTLTAARNTDYKSIRKKFIKNVHKREDEYQANNPTQKVFEKGHRRRYNNY